MKKTNYNFVLEMSIGQIEAIMDDILLHYKGYKFFYAVDTYDFVHYFIPYIESGYFRNSNLNEIAQESIAYESFFSDSKSDSIIILDEYKFELLGVRDLFLNKLKQGKEFLENFAILTAKMDQLKRSSWQILYEEIKKNFELFFLMLIFLKKKGFAKENIFLQFLRKKMHINSFDTGIVDFDDFANKIFSEIPKNDFIEKVYDQFIELGIDFLYGLKEETRNKYLENTYRDIHAIKRVLNANEEVSKNTDFRKTVFYYLSSTPFKSNLIFNIINEDLGYKFNFNNINSKGTFNINRNIFQFFFTKMLLVEYPLSPEKPLEMLEILKREIEERNKNKAKNNKSEVNEKVINEINYLLEKHSFNIENALYAGMLPYYEKTLQQITQENMSFITDSQKELMAFFSEFLKEYQNDAENTSIGYNLVKYRQLNLIKNILETQDNGKFKIRIRFSNNANDIIRFNYHHLPYLLFINDNKFTEKYTSFYEAMLRISEIENENLNQIETVIPFLRVLFEEKIVGEHKSYDSTIESLVSIYLDLLTINDNKTNSEILNNEKEIISILEEQSLIYKDLPKVPGKKLKANSKKRLSNEYLLTEISYVLLWLYRRNGFNDLGITLGSRLLKKNDPRIFHGLALCYIAKFYDPANKVKVELSSDNLDQARLKEILKLLNKSEKGYTKFLLDTNCQPLKKMIYKTLIGVYNSTADCFLRKYIHNNKTNKELLGYAKEYIKRIKNLAISLEIEYEELTIPNNTEAEIEYYEALFHFSTGDLEEAKRKIVFADERFKKSCLKSSTMYKGFYEIGEDIKKLKEKIK